MKKKQILGIVIILGIVMMAGIASAALLPYYGKIVGTVNVIICEPDTQWCEDNVACSCSSDGFTKTEEFCTEGCNIEEGVCYPTPTPTPSPTPTP